MTARTPKDRPYSAPVGHNSDVAERIGQASRDFAEGVEVLRKSMDRYWGTVSWAKIDPAMVNKR
ncbi:MAG: hypothetical protein AAF288_02870 [Planctomycetota bacterium]